MSDLFNRLMQEGEPNQLDRVLSSRDVSSSMKTFYIALVRLLPPEGLESFRNRELAAMLGYDGDEATGQSVRHYCLGLARAGFIEYEHVARNHFRLRVIVPPPDPLADARRAVESIARKYTDAARFRAARAAVFDHNKTPYYDAAE